MTVQEMVTVWDAPGPISSIKDRITTLYHLKSDGILHPDSRDIANILNNKFQKASSTKSEISKESFSDTCKMKRSYMYNTMPDIQITEEGVNKLLKET